MTDTHSSADVDNASVSHEHSDIDIAGIFKFTVGLIVVAAVVHVVIWFMFVSFEATAASADADVRSPLRVGNDVRVPPEPRLQVEPRQDLSAWRERETLLLNGYHWVDKAAGVVRIPIDDAMKRVVGSGVPTRSVQESSQKK